MTLLLAGGDGLPSKRVLIVTAGTGFGHNAVARSLSEALHRLGNGQVEVDVVDFLARHRLSWLGQFGRLYAPIIVQMPRLWGPIYDLSNNDRFWHLFQMALRLGGSSAPAEWLRDKVPHAIVCVHPVGNQVIAHWRREARWSAPLLTVITDLDEAHAAWIAPEVSLYVAPTEEIRASLLASAVDPRRVALLGLPLDRRFREDGPGRRELRRRMGLEEQTLTILLTGGGEGAGAIFAAARAISRAGLPVQLIVACGRNDALRRKLDRCCLGVPHRVLGFEQEMAQIVKAADVVIGKAGALTIGEAIAVERPLIILDPLPGQETGNTAFARRHGVALAAADVSGLIQTLERWIAHPGEMRELAAKGNGFRPEWARAADRVATAIMDLMKQRGKAACSIRPRQ